MKSLVYMLTGVLHLGSGVMPLVGDQVNYLRLGSSSILGIEVVACLWSLSLGGGYDAVLVETQ